MLHWIARMNLSVVTLKLLERVDSETAAWDRIHEIYSLQDQNNKKNQEFRIAKNRVNAKIPVYNREIHGNVKNFIRVKTMAIQALPQEDKDILAIKYIQRIVPSNHKLVYVAVHDLKE